MAQEWIVESVEASSLETRLNEIRDEGNGRKKVIWNSNISRYIVIYLKEIDRWLSMFDDEWWEPGIANIENYTEENTFFSSGLNPEGIIGDGNFIYAGCRYDGLKSFTVGDQGALTLIDTIDAEDLAAGPSQLCTDGNFIYAACGSNGIRSYSADGSGNLYFHDSDDQGGSYFNLWCDGNFVYVANGDNGVIVYSVDGSGNFTVESSRVEGSDDALSVWGDGNFIYVSWYDGGIRSYSVDGAGNLTLIDTDADGSYYLNIWGDGNFIYVSCDNNQLLKVYTVDGAGNLTFVHNYGTASRGTLWGDGTYIYSANTNGNIGLEVYTVDGAGNLTLISSDINPGTDAIAVWGDGTYIYVGSRGGDDRNPEGSIKTYTPPGDFTWNGTAWTFSKGALIPITSGINADWEDDFRPTMIKCTYSANGSGLLTSKIYRWNEYTNKGTTYNTGTTLVLSTSVESPVEKDISFTRDLKTLYFYGDPDQGFTNGHITDIEFWVE